MVELRIVEPRAHRAQPLPGAEAPLSVEPTESEPAASVPASSAPAAPSLSPVAAAPAAPQETPSSASFSRAADRAAFEAELGVALVLAVFAIAAAAFVLFAGFTGA